MEYDYFDNWLQEFSALCQPDAIHICDGSLEEYEILCHQMVAHGTFIPLNAIKRPNSFLCRSTPEDVARIEERTFICSNSREDAGPTNLWYDPVDMKHLLKGKFQGCMRGRTLYVIPFGMGPLNSSFSIYGIQLTDSHYVVCNMRLMTRMGAHIWPFIKKVGFIACLHSVGYPLVNGQPNIPWPCQPEEKYIAHFPDSAEIWSYGSGYGGNALLGKKCIALRIASVLAHREGWLAEHMLILGITNPQGKKKYFAAAFPSACGKTNLAMLDPDLPGWKIEIVGDDIAWMHFGSDGKLYAINPEFGFFGVAPGTSMYSNPVAMHTLTHDAIFTNVALTDDNDIWWEGMTKTPPAHLIDWRGNDWTPQSTTPAAHPNSRFTVSSTQCPTLDNAWENPQGVPISAIIFGGRRASTVPLVRESFNWQHGIFLGASLSSEMTAAAAGQVGALRHDPFAMLPFCGYNMGDYFDYWSKLGKTHAGPHLPKIYAVNWFKKDFATNKYLWPGFRSNCRILKWIFERSEGAQHAICTPIGHLPQLSSIDISGLPVNVNQMEQLLKVDIDEWLIEAQKISTYFQLFGSNLPVILHQELQDLQRRLVSDNSDNVLFASSLT